MIGKKAVIFDMDGVIIDSEKFWTRAEVEVFSSLGVQITEELSELTKAMTTDEVVKFWYSRDPWQNVEFNVVEEMVVSRVIKFIETEDCLMNGIIPFIEKLKSQDYKIGLATNSPMSIVKIVLQKFQLEHLFDVVSSAEFEEKGKPDPAIYITSSKKLIIPPENCTVIEDSHLGMLAAKRAGMTVIYYTNGNNNAHDDIADYKIDSFKISFLKTLIQSEI